MRLLGALRHAASRQPEQLTESAAALEQLARDCSQSAAAPLRLAPTEHSEGRPQTRQQSQFGRGRAGQRSSSVCTAEPDHRSSPRQFGKLSGQLARGHLNSTLPVPWANRAGCQARAAGSSASRSSRIASLQLGDGCSFSSSVRHRFRDERPSHSDKSQRCSNCKWHQPECFDQSLPAIVVHCACPTNPADDDTLPTSNPPTAAGTLSQTRTRPASSGLSRAPTTRSLGSPATAAALGSVPTARARAPLRAAVAAKLADLAASAACQMQAAPSSNTGTAAKSSMVACPLVPSRSLTKQTLNSLHQRFNAVRQQH